MSELFTPIGAPAKMPYTGLASSAFKGKSVERFWGVVENHWENSVSDTFFTELN